MPSNPRTPQSNRPTSVRRPQPDRLDLAEDLLSPFRFAPPPTDDPGLAWLMGEVFLPAHRPTWDASLLPLDFDAPDHD